LLDITGPGENKSSHVCGEYTTLFLADVLRIL